MRKDRQRSRHGLKPRIRKDSAIKTAALFLIICMFSSYGLGAQIYGTLREWGKPVPNVKVEVQCGASVYSTMTDNYGSYQLFAKEPGRCILRVYYQNQAPETSVDSYNEPTHDDFDLIRQPNGSYELRRR